MIVLNTEDFNDEFKNVAPKECAMYLSSCLPEDMHKRIMLCLIGNMSLIH